MTPQLPIAQFQRFIERIRPTNPDHMLRISALPAKKTPDEWWTSDERREKYYWNPEYKKPWSRQWWLDWSGSNPALCNAKGEVKKSGWPEIFRYLSTYNRVGYGIYVQLNPCLLGDSGQSDALPGRAIFTESDGAIPTNSAESYKVTAALVEQAKALDPDLVVTTFKSAHTYRIGDRLYPTVGGWQVDQTRLTQKAREIWGAETDESLIDANQLMRLPGFNHARWQDGRMQFHPVQIAFDNGKTHAAIDEGLPELAAPIASKAEGEAHDFTPFELASFAHLLEGYKENGRKGFDTCRCPAHGGEATDSLHINQATGQYTCHAECDSKAVYQAALKIAIAKGYQLPARTEQQEHWAYEEPYTGVWGEVGAQFNKPVFFKEDAPDLLLLLPASLQSKIVAAKSISSPQAIALKAYAEFLSKAGHPGYIADAKELIGEAWDWCGIPSRTPLWGWKGFIKAIQSFSGKETRKALNTCCDAIKKDAADAKAAEIRAQADKWEMIPEGVEWLDTQYFGDAILKRVQAAGSDRMTLGIFGATGTGKTYALKRVRQWAKSQGRQLVYLTVKEQLARASGRDTGLNYRLDLDGSGEKEQYPDIAACAASLIESARGISWETQISPNAIIVIDEDDLFAAVTAGVGAGSNALELQRVLRSVLQSGQTIISMSAQHKSRHQKLWQRLSDCDRSEMIGILSAAVPKAITLYDDTAAPDSDLEIEGDDREELPTSPLKNVLIAQMSKSLQVGRNVLVLTGSQKPDSKLGTMLLEPFALEECGAKSVLRLDSQSTKDPSHAAFKIADKDYVAAFRAVQFAVCSPSAQEGFSLKFGDGAKDSHFAEVYCFDPGSKLPEQIIQDAGRDRHSTPTHISVSPGHTLKKFGGTTDPSEVRRQLRAIASQKETKLLDVALSNSPHNWDSAYLSFYCEDVAQSNAALADKVYNLTRYFKAVGHEVKIVVPTPGLSATGIPEEFYERIAAEHYYDPISKAADVDRFYVEELQQKGEVTREQWYQIQRLQFRQSMRWDTSHSYDIGTDSIQSPSEQAEGDSQPSTDKGLEIDPAFVRQWSRDRVAKPWQMYFYAQQNEWDWFAHDFKRTRFNPKHETLTDAETLTADFAPVDILSLKSRRLSLLKELGILDFMNRWAVDTADKAIATVESSTELAKTLHELHKFNRFTKADLQPVVEKLAPQFEKVCELLGVKSQRNDDGEVNHRQVLTIVRNVFQVKTFAITNASLNGTRGVYLLVADDKAQALRKGLIKAEKLKEPVEVQKGIAKAHKLYKTSHNRTEMRDRWTVHLEVERAMLRMFLREKSYKIGLLDDKRPDTWCSLGDRVKEQEKVVAAATERTMNEVVQAVDETQSAEPQTEEWEPTPGEGASVLMTRLAWCQDAGEYNEIRQALECQGLDFEAQCWPQLSAEQQQRIHSFFAVAQG